MACQCSKRKQIAWNTGSTNLLPSQEFPWQMFGLFVVILGAYAVALLLVSILC